MGKLASKVSPGKGSLFWFEIPVVVIEEPSAPNYLISTDVEYSEIDHSKNRLHILIVEDVLPNQLVARKLVEKLGHSVEIVSNGVEAVTAVSKGSYDLVLMDLRMPVMDGLSATREIRKLKSSNAQVPIIAMTANTTEEDKRVCLETGMNDFIGKPIDRKLLNQVLARFS